MVGGNFRLDALQCALLRAKLPHLPAYCAARQRNAAFYTQQLAGLPGVTLPIAAAGNDHIWNQFTLRIAGAGRRDSLRQQLAAAGIGCEIYYPVPLHQQECFAHLPRVSLAVAEQLATEVISVPVFPELSATERDEVVAALQRHLGGG
jgi:dTDP-4-amino-4,6-dideoxygalactose transaminase